MVQFLKVKFKGMNQLNKTFSHIKKLPEEIGKANLFIAKMYKRALQQQYISQRKRAGRKQTASLFTAQRLSKFQSVVKLPSKAIMLDSMEPHYVSLKRGRAITKWAQKFYSPDTIFKGAGLSKVYRGPKGGVKGFLFVTPDPFIDQALLRVTPKITPILQRTINKVVR